MDRILPNQRKHPAVWVPTLYFAEGVPYFVVNLMALIFYQRMGISNEVTTFITGLLALPWVLKLFWSPFLELYKTKKFFVLSMECLGGLSMGLLAFCLPSSNYFRYSICFLGLLALFSSTHDIAADGLYISSLNPSERAAYAGWQSGFYNVARFFVQGGLIIFAGFLEARMPIVKAWMIVFALMGGILALLSLYHLRTLPRGAEAQPQKNLREIADTFGDVVLSFFKKPKILLLLSFILLSRLGEGQILKIGPLFLKAARDSGGLGLSTAQFGTVYGTLGTIAFVVGTLLGGQFAARAGLKRALAPLIVILNLPTLVYVYLSIALPALPQQADGLGSLLFSTVTSALILEMFAYGFGFVSIIVLMMQEIAPGKYQTAHYAFASALMNLGAILPSAASGFIQTRIGYRNFFIWALLCGIPAIVLSFLAPIVSRDGNAGSHHGIPEAGVEIPEEELVTRV